MNYKIYIKLKIESLKLVLLANDNEQNTYKTIWIETNSKKCLSIHIRYIRENDQKNKSTSQMKMK